MYSSLPVPVPVGRRKEGRNLVRFSTAPIQTTINKCKKRRLSFLKSNSFEISLFQRIIQERTREGRVELGDTGNARCGKFLEQRWAQMSWNISQRKLFFSIRLGGGPRIDFRNKGSIFLAMVVKTREFDDRG
jgi:hypothetical protein